MTQQWTGRRLWSHPVLLGTVATTVGVVVWIVFLPRVGTDLSAQIARAHFAAMYPGSAYDFSWYGGIVPAGYSILSPYLLAAIGIRQATGLAAIGSAGLLAVLLVRSHVPRPRAAALWAAFALCTGLLAGQATFNLGLCAALGCVVAAEAAWPHPLLRRCLVATLSVLCSMLSPVAGLFLGLVGAVYWLRHRRVDGVVVAASACGPLAIVAFFANGGVQPIGALDSVPSLLAVAFVVVLSPPRWQAIRIGAIVYAASVVITWVMPNPVGSNIERLGLLLAGPLLVGLTATTRRRKWLLAGVLTATAVWQVVVPVRNLAQGSAPPMRDAGTAALRQELRLLHADTARVEAVPQYGHWESAELADTVPLARGWERQIDAQRNPLFYRQTLAPHTYHHWLLRNAVGYVAISTATPDYAAVTESALINAGQPWLRQVWHDRTWRLYRVVDARPLASPPAITVATNPASITVRMTRPGTTVIRVYYSRVLRVIGDATIARSGNWTSLTTALPGTYTLTGRY